MRNSRYRWAPGTERRVTATLLRLTIPVYLPVFFLAFSWSSLTPAFPQYLTSLGAEITTVGMIIAMKGIGQMVSDAPGGFLLASGGLRRITILSYIIAIAANTILFWSRSLGVITMLTFISGFSTSILLTTVMAIIRSSVPAELRGRALSGVGGAVRIGMLFGPIIGGVIAETAGVPPVFLLRVGGLSAGLLFFSLGMPRDDRKRSADQASLQNEKPRPTPLLVKINPFRGIRDVFNDLSGRWFAVVTVGFGILILSVLRSSREIILPLWGTAAGFSPSAIGVAMSVGAAFDLLLFIPAGVISDRWGRRVAAGLCLGFFSVGLLVLLPADTYVLYIVAASLIGFGNGLGAGINMTTGADLAPDRFVAEFLGLWRLYGDIGSASGPIIVGALAGAIMLGPAVAITALIGFFGMAVIVFIAPETRDLQ